MEDTCEGCLSLPLIRCFEFKILMPATLRNRLKMRPQSTTCRRYKSVLCISLSTRSNSPRPCATIRACCQ
jgi:hypothetical protein